VEENAMVQKALLYSVGLIASIVTGISARAGAEESAIPNFTSADSGWLLAGGIDFHPVQGQVPPVSFDPQFPVGQGNARGVMERMSDARNPNLKRWAQEQMRLHNDLVLTGHRAFTAQARCWPGGVPGQLLVPAEPIFFIQTPQEVWIIWQRDHMVRRIFLNREHSKNPKPDWFGESVGHYENGELLVDTIGFNEHRYSFVDNWRTPHTKDLHVVERWKLIDGGNAIQATVTVDDPGTFNKPWSGTAQWRKVKQGPMIESVCAENNLNYEKFFKLNEYPMPEATTPDF
jgi:hypothetical protein